MSAEKKGSGPLRTKSEDRLKVPSRERETLMQCEPCKGGGMTLKTTSDGRYRSTKCKWCSGEGFWPRHMAAGFERWKRIVRVANRNGRCIKPVNSD